MFVRESPHFNYQWNNSRRMGTMARLCYDKRRVTARPRHHRDGEKPEARRGRRSRRDRGAARVPSLPWLHARAIRAEKNALSLPRYRIPPGSRLLAENFLNTFYVQRFYEIKIKTGLPAALSVCRLTESGNRYKQ